MFHYRIIVYRREKDFIFYIFLKFLRLQSGLTRLNYHWLGWLARSE
jgi:hypothetical protein